MPRRRRNPSESANAHAPLDIPKALATAAELIALHKDTGGHAAICGGFAMMAHGYHRMTKDIDLVALTGPDFPSLNMKVLRPLTFGGTAFEIDGIPVDWIVRDDDEAHVYQDALEHAIFISPWSGAPRLPVLSAVHMLLIKMLAGRGRDITDAKWLFTNKKVTKDQFLKLVKRLYGSAAYLLRKDYEQLELEATLRPE